MAPGAFPAAPPPPLLTWGAQLGRGARRALLRGALGLSLALLLLWAAAFLYGSFYWAYLPAAAVLQPLHLGFRSDCERPGPELCSFPTANVSLLGEHREKLLLYGQLYRISLELELPESPVNRELGMFMVGLSLYGNGGRTLARSERAAMLHYRSRLLRALHTAFFAGLFLSGFAEQSQTLELELLGRYREDPYSPTVGALVEIRSRRVQLYGARLRVHAHFSGLRYLLYHFPLTSAVVGVAGNWALLALLTLGGYLQWGRGGPRPRPRPAQERRDRGGAPGEGEGTDPPEPPQNSEEPEMVGAAEPGPEPPLLSPAPKEGEGREEEEEEGEGQEEEEATPTSGHAPSEASGTQEMGEKSEFPAPNLGENSSNLGGNSANLGGNSLVLGGNSSNLGENSPILGGNSGNLGEISSNLGGNCPVLGGNSLVLGGNSSNLGEISSNLGENSSNLGGNSPVLGENSSILGRNSPILGENPPNLGGSCSILGGNSSNLSGSSAILGENSSVLGENPAIFGANPSVLSENSTDLGANPAVLGGNPPNLGGDDGDPETLGD